MTSYPKERRCRVDGSILVKNEEARRSVRAAFKVGWERKHGELLSAKSTLYVVSPAHVYVA